MAKKRGPKNPRFPPKIGLLRRDFEWPLISKKVAAYFDYYITQEEREDLGPILDREA